MKTVSIRQHKRAMGDSIQRFIDSDPGAYDSPEQSQETRDHETAGALRERRLRQVEQAILETPHGREWLWGVLTDLKVFEVTIAVAGTSYEQGFWNGQAHAGQRLMRRLARAHPENFARMLSEFDQA